ncbi:SigE family RNA polymerase sigma factor [Streptomyces sp. HPF1205]|uniref:SigE family RNA polymerase sigma factor n=1 Tax=Streptomyces sp. HPF1205 TaxID=2873262 RepID=UPI001CED3F8E|nr:SigE family RNA polymerase sigma factor [Streptomyces sp. HPF1205]
MQQPDDPTAAGGPDAEFTRFVAARWRALTRTAYLLTGDFHEAEDLVQTTLARVYPAWRRVRPETAEHYVRRALVNTNRSRYRRRRVIHLLLPTLPDASAVEHGGGVGGGGDRDVLMRALADLPERQRAVVVLRYWEDLPAEEVAATLGCSVGTVKSQASRALAKLRGHPALADLSHPADLPLPSGLGDPR